MIFFTIGGSVQILFQALPASELTKASDFMKGKKDFLKFPKISTKQFLLARARIERKIYLGFFLSLVYVCVF